MRNNSDPVQATSSLFARKRRHRSGSIFDDDAPLRCVSGVPAGIAIGMDLPVNSLLERAAFEHRETIDIPSGPSFSTSVTVRPSAAA